MSRDTVGRFTGTNDTDPVGAETQEAIGNFRSSIHAWSEAAYRQPSWSAAPSPHALAWRRTLAWALGVLVTVGAASGAVYEHHHQQVLAWQAQQRHLQQERVLASKRAAEMDELMAQVDQDVSQEVPDALEPLATMMTDNGSKK